MIFYELKKNDFQEILYERKDDANKGDFGYISLIGGSTNYQGAIRLAALGNVSMRSGVGVVKLGFPDFLYDNIARDSLETTLFKLTSIDGHIKFVEEEIKNLIKNTKVVAIGMGIGKNLETKKIIDYLLKNYEGILLIDADGINSLSEMDDEILLKTKAKVVLTPHLKEFSRLLHMKKKICDIDFTKFKTFDEEKEIIKEKKEELARDFSKYYNLYLLVKGNKNVITDGRDIYIIKKGTPGMATAGSGDVLSGIMSAILAYNTNNILKAMVVSVFINGLSGEIAAEKNGEISMIASDTAKSVRDAINNIKKNF